MKSIAPGDLLPRTPAVICIAGAGTSFDMMIYQCNHTLQNAIFLCRGMWYRKHSGECGSSVSMIPHRLEKDIMDLEM